MLLLLDPRPCPLYVSILCIGPSSLPLSALNLVSSIPRVLCVQLTNGHCAFLLPSWPNEFSTPPLTSICPGLEHSTLNRGFQTPLPTASAFRGWSAVSSAVRAPHLHPACLLLIWQSLDLRLPDHLMFWASRSLAYFGFLHALEFTVPSLASFSPLLHLGVQDIAVDYPSVSACMHVKIKGSKTDPFKKGAFIHIGLGQPPLCTVHSVMTYLASRGNLPGPLFLFQNGQPLSCALLTDWLWQILASANIPGNFSSHSFHIGAATVAARNGVPDHLIQALGRWSSSAYQLYIRTPSKSLAALSTTLASSQWPSISH